MYACHHSRRVKRAHNRAADTEGKRNQRLGTVQNPVFDGREDRPDDRQRHIPGHHHRHQRGHKQVDNLRHNLVQLFLNHRHEPYGDHYRDHVALVSHQIYIIQSEPDGCLRDIRRVHAGYRPGVQKIGMNHNHTDDRSQELVSSEYLRRADGDQDRQECKRRVAEQMEDHIGSGLCHLGPDIAEALQKPHQKTAGHNCRYDRHKNISQRLDRAFEDILFRVGRLFYLFFRRTFNARDFDELVVNLIDRTGSQDNLHLTGSEKDPLYAVDLFHLFLVAFVVVANHQTKSGRAVRGGNQVRLPSDPVVNFPRRLLVIHNTSPPCVFMKTISLIKCINSNNILF